MEKYKILSTFTGAGGLDLGFHGGFNYLGKEYKELPFENIYALDNNELACQTLRNDKKYFTNTKVICEDISKYPPETLTGGGFHAGHLQNR